MILSWLLFLAKVAGIVVAVVLTYSLLVAPYLKLQFYKRQGGKVDFIPIIGRFGLLVQQTNKTGDFFYQPKQEIKRNPNIAYEAQNLGPGIILFLNDPKLLREFFTKQDHYIKFEPTVSLFKVLLGNGLLTSDGELWKHHRRLISSLFHYEFLKSNIPMIVETTREFLDELEKQTLERVIIMDEFQKITGEVVGRIFFGKSLSQYSLDGKPLTLFLADIISETGVKTQDPLRMIIGNKIYMKFPHMKKLQNKIQKFRKLCFKIISERKEQMKESKERLGDKKDLLGLLLENQNQESAYALNDEEIIDEFVSFFLAGMDTTGHLLTMISYNLALHPQYLETLREEVSRLYEGKNVDEITINDLNGMEFMGLVIKETLRYNSPVPSTLPREAIDNHMLGDLKILKGTAVSPAWVQNSVNSKHFENPEKYNPYRWVNEAKNIDPFIFTPFSAGPHNCIGQHLAQIETRIILSEFLSRFDYKISEGYIHKMTFRFLYEPVDPLPFNLTKHGTTSPYDIMN